MTEISAIIYGKEEETEPLKPCGDCGDLPMLAVYVNGSVAQFSFECPNCGRRIPLQFSVRYAKSVWNESLKVFENSQTKMDDFSVEDQRW